MAGRKSGRGERVRHWRQGRRVAPVALAALAALAVAGCGSESHPNEPRTGLSVRVSVTIGPNGVLVQPRSIATGPEKTQQLPQNQGQPQPPTGREGPLDVVLVASNQTDTDTGLELRGPTNANSGPIPAQSPGTMQTELPSGVYMVRAKGIPDARPAKLIVGDYRASSQNDLLTP